MCNISYNLFRFVHMPPDLMTSNHNYPGYNQQKHKREYLLFHVFSSKKIYPGCRFLPFDS